MLDGWASQSRHEFTVFGLPAHKWKWRMRHAPVTVVERLQADTTPQSWDVCWVSDMLDLATFRGLAPIGIRDLPTVVYYHENQLTYPTTSLHERDLHFAFTNLTTAIAADELWFNSRFHLDEFFLAMRQYVARMPDFQPMAQLAELHGRATVQYPGVDLFPARRSLGGNPMRICWNARWEHDKNAGDFFEALRRLRAEKVPFRLILLGESFSRVPAEFERARHEFADELIQYGFADSREEYRRLLQTADLVVSTARHEFFGIGVVEAIAAGAFPLLPNRLAYPEIIASMGLPAERHLYDGTVSDLVRLLVQAGKSFSGYVDDAQAAAAMARRQAATCQFGWQTRASEMDEALAKLLHRVAGE